MKKTNALILTLAIGIFLLFSSEMSLPRVTLAADDAAVNAEAEDMGADNEDWILGEDYLSEDTSDGSEDISDPLEPVNRVFYHFNDKLYFWVLKPVCKGYSKVVPEPARKGIRSFFSNIYTPVRAANCLLQGKFTGFWREIARFIINTTAGGLGFRDAAEEDYHVAKSSEDFGQTLGVYGLGFGPYLVIPFIGPSSVRDAVGSAADSFMYPPNYMMNTWESMGRSAFRKINDISLRLGEYESFKEMAIDPYIAIRQAYFQYRIKQIKK
ncbi:MAG: VacJ family lipoprotein [Thermodesulfobacteria bacterium]|nr:VacJ family lipoprotein [Thermodesulfobacteriota bacterium]